MLEFEGLKILLVEDHLALREVFSEYLTAQGHYIFAYESAEAALESAEISTFQIALLDLNLPGEDGLYLAERLRMQAPNIGIIMLTVRNQIADKIAGYNAGADIYLPKPVIPEELNATIQAVCRRIQPLIRTDLTLNFSTQQLTNSDHESVTLSLEETRLITTLSQAPQQQLELWELAEYLGLDLESGKLRTTIEKRVSRLRQKLAQLNQPTSAIKFIRGYGYQLTLSVNII